MIFGKSILHVNQTLGLQFKPGEVYGYFNNLTEKVTKDVDALRNESLPKMFDDNGREVIFPVSIFQYGLGAFDLMLEHKKDIYSRQFWRCVEWAYKNQNDEGAWSMGDYIPPEEPYGAMCQGEGASLLLRAYKLSNNKEYLKRAIRAIDFMLRPLEKGGTSVYSKNDLVLLEFTNRPCVFNGWVFAIFGLYDLTLIIDADKYHNALNKTVTTLRNSLNLWDCGYWSLYNEKGMIASPFYHNLHIAQLEALELAFPSCGFGKLKDKFVAYRNNKFYKKKAFMNKAIQKLLE